MLTREHWLRALWWVTRRPPSNAWPKRLRVWGWWEPKEPFSYNVIDPFNQHFLVWVFPDAGGKIQTHVHDFDHASILQVGTVVVHGDAERPNGTICTGPDTFIFKKGKQHSIKALTPGVVMVHTYPPGFVPPNGD
jgi:hypothetical protein